MLACSMVLPRASMGMIRFRLDGDLPVEPFGDAANGCLGAPAHRPALADPGSLPKISEERLEIVGPDLPQH